MTYMSRPDAVGKNNGATLRAQFQAVFSTPGVDTVIISSWNEWASIRLPDQVGGDPNRAAYTDTYNEEYNRDIEPQDGGK